MSTHDEMLDSVAVYALGALDAAEARAVEEHLRTCDLCRAEYDALRPVVTAVGSAVGTDLAPSALLKARIMREVRSQKARAPRAVSWLPYAFAAACLLLAAGLGAVVVEQNHAIIDLASAQRYSFEHGEVLVSHDRLYVVARGLPALPNGKVYQLWTLAKGASNVTPSVTFTPDKGGNAIVPIPIDTADTVATAISIEPEGGSQQPTTKPIAFVRFGT